MALLAHVSGRQYPEPAEPEPVIDAELAAKGQLYYVVKCAECHNLGNVIGTPEAKRQGPDLIHISQRLRYEWIPEWVKNPLAVYPGTTMVDTNLTDDEIHSIRAFLWKHSTASQ
jgi:cytochrome c2